MWLQVILQLVGCRNQTGHRRVDDRTVVNHSVRLGRFGPKLVDPFQGGVNDVLLTELTIGADVLHTLDQRAVIDCGIV